MRMRDFQTSRLETLHHWMERVMLVIACVIMSSFPLQALAVSSWSPTLLVNTESFEIIDGGNQATDVELRFGATNEKFYWNFTKGQFEVSDDLNILNNVTSSGTLAIEQSVRTKADLTINSDNDTNNAVLTFGNQTLASTLSFMHASQKFRFSTSVDVVGTLSGTSLTVSSLRNCDTIDTNGSGVLACGTDDGGGGGITQNSADARYVNASGDTMTGALTVQNGTTHTPTTAPLLNLRGTLSGALLRASNMTLSGAVVYSSGNTLRQSAKGLSGQVLIAQGTSAPKWVNPLGGLIWYFDGTQATAIGKGPQITMPFGMTLSGVTMSAKGAPTGSAYIVDINKNGTTVFSTRPEIAASATTGGTNAVFSVTAVQPNSVLTLDIDQVGSTFAGSGMTVILKGTRNY